jgi:hypothetical protein
VLKTVSSVGNSLGALNYKGSWNASTNTPTLTSGVGTKGDYYVVSVAGTTNLDGTALWSVGDWATFNGSIWQKIDGSTSEAFVSITVTGLTGYMYGNNTSPVTASTTIPVANVTGAVPNTVNVIAGTNLTGGGALTGNVTINNPYNGTVTSVATGTGLTGGPITTSGTISISSTGVVAATYGTASSVAQIAINAQGQATSASNVAISIAPSQINAAIPNSGLANSTATLGNATITLGSTTTSVGNLTLTNVNISSGNAAFTTANSTNATITNLSTGNVTVTGGSINVQSTNIVSTTSSTATYGTASLPLQPLGFIQVDLNGTVVKVPYYAV